MFVDNFFGLFSKAALKEPKKFEKIPKHLSKYIYALRYFPIFRTLFDANWNFKKTRKIFLVHTYFSKKQFEFHKGIG